MEQLILDYLKDKGFNPKQIDLYLLIPPEKAYGMGVIEVEYNTKELKIQLSDLLGWIYTKINNK